MKNEKKIKTKLEFSRPQRFIICFVLAEISKIGVVRASKSNSRHLVRRTCFNLPKTSSNNLSNTGSSLTPPIQSNNAPFPASTSAPSAHSYFHPAVDGTLSAPLNNRKTTNPDELNQSQRHHLLLSASQSKEAPSRGISPRLNRNTPTSNIYNPSAIEKL